MQHALKLVLTGSKRTPGPVVITGLYMYLINLQHLATEWGPGLRVLALLQAAPILNKIKYMVIKTNFMLQTHALSNFEYVHKSMKLKYKSSSSSQNILQWTVNQNGLWYSYTDGPFRQSAIITDMTHRVLNVCFSSLFELNRRALHMVLFKRFLISYSTFYSFCFELVRVNSISVSLLFACFIQVFTRVF